MFHLTIIRTVIKMLIYPFFLLYIYIHDLLILLHLSVISAHCTGSQYVYTKHTL